jgi:hypothetical protein
MLKWREDAKGCKNSCQKHLACKLAIFVLLGRRGTSAIYLHTRRKADFDLSIGKEPEPSPPLSPPLHHPSRLARNVLGRETFRRMRFPGGSRVTGGEAGTRHRLTGPS